MSLKFSLLMRLLVGGGFIAAGPAVTSITSATQTEGTSLVHTVTLATAVSVIPALYPFSISNVTASTPSDYTATPTFNNSVTLSGNTLTVPVGVSGFTITVATSQDTVYEGTETYSISVGGMSNTGTLTDDDSAPTIASVSSASATEGSSITHVVVVTGTAQAARTFAIAFSGSSATAGTDYTSTLSSLSYSSGVTYSGGNVSVPPGVTAFTVGVPTSVDALVEGSETYTLTIGGASGTGTIVDANAGADFFLNLTSPTNATIGDSQATGTITAQAADFFLNLTSPTNATIGDAQAVGTLTGSGGSLIPSIAESRLSGVAPLAVLFDATGTTSTQTTRPQHDIFYAWDFGDTGAGTWANGTGAHTNRNLAYGPVSSHVFETAGPHVVTLTVFDGVSTTSTTKTITVSSADTVWAGTNTVCYSTTSDFTGAPSGCTQVPNVTDISASFAANKGSGGKRHLLHAGQTFAIASRLTINVGAGVGNMMGKFGSGADPIINSNLTSTSVIGLSDLTTPIGVSDWRFQDFKIDCNNQNNSSAFASNGSYSDVLINRVYMTRCGYGLLMSGSTLSALNASVPYTHAMWDKVFMVDSTIYDLYTSASGPNAIFANAARVAIMGCNIDNNGHGEHGIRFQYCNRGVFNNNTIQGIAATKVNLTIRGAPYGGDNNLVGPGVYSEKVVISDNRMIGGLSVGIVGFGPQNGVSDERGRNFIFERNFLSGTTATQNTVQICYQDFTMRNNMLTLPAGAGGGYFFGAQPSGQVPCPTRVNIYNNSCYHGGSGAFNWALFTVNINNDSGTPIDQTLPGCVFEVKNNILYCPTKPSTWYNMTYKDAAAQSVTTESNNTANATNTVSPLFATNPPTAVAHFTPAGGSYANGAGIAVKNWRDFYGTATQATPDLGAVVI